MQEEHDRLLGTDPRREFRHQVAAALEDRADIMVNDTVAVFPRTGRPAIDVDTCARFSTRLIAALAETIRAQGMDYRADHVRELFAFWSEQGIPFDPLLELFYLTERTVLDELALEETLGATSEAWPRVAQLVRHASFQLLSALAERLSLEPQVTQLTDRLTTLFTRPVLELVLDRAVKHAVRYGHPISLILLDIDRLAVINDAYGFGVGDRVLERLGILLRKFFREIDYAARMGEGRFAVLLPETQPDDAMLLAEGVRAAVEDRLTFRDHRTDQRIHVTVSGSVSGFAAASAEGVDGDRLFVEAEAALKKAKEQGRNRIERSQPHVREELTLKEAARLLNCSPPTVRRLIAEAGLPAWQVGSDYRLDRAAVQAWIADRAPRSPNSPDEKP